MESWRQASYPAAMKHQFIYHMCRKPAWQAARQSGEYAGSEIDLKDGFIHFSTSDQLAETAALHLAGIEDLLLLKVHVETVSDDLKWETSRDRALFPHLYRPLRCDEAVEIFELKLDASGRHVFPWLV